MTQTEELQLQKQEIPEIEWIDNAADLLDTKFRIPGTQIRFGADFIIGLIPYAGDVLSFMISGILVLAMARHGVSGRVVLLMLWNIFLDTIVGTIPIFGDIFDLTYRANWRNVQLLRAHYYEGKHKGSAWKIILFV